MTKRHINYQKSVPLQHQGQYRNSAYKRFIREIKFDEFAYNIIDKMDLFHRILTVLAAFSQEIIQNDPDGFELKNAIEIFRNKFNPGKPDTIPDSYLETWAFLDITYAKHKSVASLLFIVLDDLDEDEKLNKFVFNLIVLMASYFAFYRLIEINNTFVILEDIYTKKRWKVIKVGLTIDKSTLPKKGEILFTRLYGNEEEAFMGCSPLGFNADSEEGLLEIINSHIAQARTEFEIEEDMLYGFSRKEYLFETMQALFPGE